MWAAGATQAQPGKVEAFDTRTWAQLQASLRGPAVVVFTTTDCVHCPGAIRTLAGEIKKRKLAAQLITVVMDAAPGEMDDALLRDPHYRPSDRLLAFSGQAAAIRHTVNPRWRGVTPYLAFLEPGCLPAWGTGPPRKQDIDAWAQPAGRVCQPSPRRAPEG